MTNAPEVPTRPDRHAAPGMPHTRSWVGVALSLCAVLGLLAVAAQFYRQTYVGLTDRTAMDMAQVGRNVADGRGFTTRLLRPFNVAMVPSQATDRPELNNAPAMPYVLAAGFRARGVSDQVVVWASLAFAVLALVATYLLGRVLFDHRVGLLAAVTTGVGVGFLRTAVTGREWTMEALWFTLLLLALALHHRSAGARKRVPGIVWTVAAAAMVAALYLTDYMLAVVIVPVAVYFWVSGTSRKLHLLIFLAAAIALMLPYAVRNLDYTGFPLLGVRAWDVMAHSSAMPGDNLYRTTDPAVRSVSKVVMFGVESFGAFADKLVTGSGEATGALGAMLGFAVMPFAVVSMLYRFKRPQANAVRGLIYGLAPVVVLTIALLNTDFGAVAMFVPVAAVFSAGYFLLLLDSKKLHPVYSQMLITGYLFLAGCQSLPALIWQQPDSRPAREMAADKFFTHVGSDGGGNALVYTDAPWSIAWRTNGTGLWVPMTEDDMTNLAAAHMPLHQLVLTPESERFSPDEIWYVLHRVKLWREYIQDHDRAVKDLLEALGAGESQKGPADRAVARLKRDYAVSDSLSGFVTLQKLYPEILEPDDVQIIAHPDIVPSGRIRE